MAKKIIGYALVNADDKFLVFNQFDSDGVEVTTTDNVDFATIFPTESEAHTEGYGVKFGTSIWSYYPSKDAVPCDIVKVEKVIKVKRLSKAFDKHKM